MYSQSSFTGNVAERGELYLVATPIGNLEDMTVRAVNILKMVDIIAAEDTRQTKKLLNHFEIETRLISHHEHNKETSVKGIIELLNEGKKIALVSDAGMPAISDPGYELVREAAAQNIPVIPIPGANAALSALIASGLPTAQFVFVGFLPREKKEIKEQLKRLQYYSETLIFYEAPHRIVKTLEQMQEFIGNRQVSLARELTKRYEEFIRGTLDEVIPYLREQDQIRGEFCIVVEGYIGDQPEKDEAQWWSDLDPIEHVERYVEQGLSTKEAIKKTAEDRGTPKRDIYNLYHT
jgi:16S rRNA (cytidine1402-2'-O)-methyltransferase